MSQCVTTTDTEIVIEVDEGCVGCPFAKENTCGCNAEVTPTHDYVYPTTCSMLDKTIIVKRRR